MLFNSAEFVPFCLLVLLVYHGCLPARRWGARKVFLVAASFLFYMSWKPSYGLLLLASTLLGFTAGLGIDRSAGRRRRVLLALGIAANLGLLAFFKYGTFLADTAHALFGSLLGPPDRGAVAVTLPIGISFYTFESIAYLVDVYRGQAAATTNLLDFTLFLSFFPHLVAGPIVRPRYFLDQLSRPPAVTGEAVEDGLARIAVGFAKKVLLADTLGAYVDGIWNGDPARYGGANLLLAMYAYPFQIYLDFSGYTDIALGLARLFGLRLPENFERPYLAASPREFWQRWHISLSTWLRDYLYVPLGGNRGSTARTYLNVLVTMALGGLWHGASWTFVAWGLYHGVLLVVHRAVGRAPAAAGSALVHAVKSLVMFHLVALGWVLFRAPSFAAAWAAFHGLAAPGFSPSRAAGKAMVVTAAAAALHLAPPQGRVRRALTELPPWIQGLGYAGLTTLVFLFSPTTEGFIYFQF